MKNQNELCHYSDQGLMIHCRNDSKGSNLNNLADLEGDTLTMYGSQSLEALDRNWGVQAAGAVTTVIFKFIDFEEIARHLHKIRTRFPATQVNFFHPVCVYSLFLGIW